MNPAAAVWKSETLAKTFLGGVRGAIPLAAEQLDLMLRLVAAFRPEPHAVLDLGCGDGILGRAIQGKYPEARATFVDFSEPMLAAARSASVPGRSAFLALDFGDPSWVEAVRVHGPFDAVVSGLAIHHQPDDRKRAIYAEIFDLLAPGGVFLNLEHVASPTPRIGRIFDELFIDSLHAHHGDRPREAVAHEFYHRPDKAANILADVGLQCDWLRAAGFAEVDCFFKILELALFGGIRPDNAARNH